MKLIVAMFAGALALSSVSALAADAVRDEQATGETKTEKAKTYVQKKANAAKVKSKRAAKKVRQTIAERKTTDPASPNESLPASQPK